MRIKFKPSICSVLVMAALLASCGNKSTQQVQTYGSVTTSQATVQTPPEASFEKVKFKLDGGSEAFSLKPKADGAKLETPDGQELARLTVDKQKVKIKDASDRVLGYAIAKDGYWKLENAEQTEELFILRQQDDGDYKLETGADEAVYRIKKRDYGWEIETPQKQSLYKVKDKEGKISLRDASDRNVLTTKSEVAPIAVACFGFDVLSREQQAALAYAVNLSGEL